MKNPKVRTILGLILLYTAVLLNWEWVWGVLFLVWVIPDLFSGITYFIEPIEKKENPILYWIIVMSWLWMSIYILATPFVPQLNAQGINGNGPVKQVGIYEDNRMEKEDEILAINAGLQQPATSIGIGIAVAETKIKSSDTLQYKLYLQEQAQYYVGISATLNANDPKLAQQTQELWSFFNENDISLVIPNIIDERVYFIYSPMDKDGSYTATIGYQTKDLKDIYEGLEGVHIPSGEFAVFEQSGKNSEKFIADTWKKINTSSLSTGNGAQLEVYELDTNFNVRKSEIRVSLK